MKLIVYTLNAPARERILFGCDALSHNAVLGIHIAWTDRLTDRVTSHLRLFCINNYFGASRTFPCHNNLSHPQVADECDDQIRRVVAAADSRQEVVLLV
jgi:hypothetical protein